MNPRQFPGAPLQASFFPVQIKKLGEEFVNGNAKSKEIGEILKEISVIMYSGREYFDLYMGIQAYYGDLSKFYNREVFQKVGGTIGTGEKVAIDPENAVVVRQTRGMNHMVLNKFLGILSYLGDEGEIQKINLENDPELQEKCNILSIILWTVYMSIYKDVYFSMTKSMVKRFYGVTLRNRN